VKTSHVRLIGSLGALALVAGIGVSILAAAPNRQAATDGPAPALPRDATGAEVRLLGEAEAALTAACLRRQGFQFPSTAGLAGSDAVAVSSTRFPYVVDDPEWARTHGYQSDRTADDRALAAAADRNEQYVRTLSASRRAVLAGALNGNGPQDPGPTVRLPNGTVVGHSSHGCTAEAETALYGDFGRWFPAKTFVQALPRMWHGQVLADPRYTAAVRGWANCMHDAGYPYADPAAAHAAFLDTVRPQPGPAELRTATAEASCAVRTGLGDAARRLEAQYRDALLDRYRSEVITERQLVLAAIPRALHHTERVST
jgi:hypothetical protein